MVGLELFSKNRVNIFPAGFNMACKTEKRLREDTKSLVLVIFTLGCKQLLRGCEERKLKFLCRHLVWNMSKTQAEMLRVSLHG